MAALLLAGALAALHIRPAWRSRRIRWSDIPTLAAGALLIGTAPLLYYAGSDALRGWASDLHIAAGGVLPLALLVHWRGGRQDLASAASSATEAGCDPGPTSHAAQHWTDRLVHRNHALGRGQLGGEAVRPRRAWLDTAEAPQLAHKMH